MASRRAKPAPGPLAIWADAMVAGAAAAVTLSVRLPQAISGTMTEAEAVRMVGEKVAAAGEGLAAASAAAARIAMKRLWRPAPHLAARDMMEIADAASRPARRRVKANARRLSTRG